MRCSLSLCEARRRAPFSPQDVVSFASPAHASHLEPPRLPPCSIYLLRPELGDSALEAHGTHSPSDSRSAMSGSYLIPSYPRFVLLDILLCLCFSLLYPSILFLVSLIPINA